MVYTHNGDSKSTIEIYVIKGPNSKKQKHKYH